MLRTQDFEARAVWDHAGMARAKGSRGRVTGNTFRAGIVAGVPQGSSPLTARESASNPELWALGLLAWGSGPPSPFPRSMQ